MMWQHTLPISPVNIIQAVEYIVLDNEILGLLGPWQCCAILPLHLQQSRSLNFILTFLATPSLWTPDGKSRRCTQRFQLLFLYKIYILTFRQRRHGISKAIMDLCWDLWLWSCMGLRQWYWPRRGRYECCYRIPINPYSLKQVIPQV